MSKVSKTKKVISESSESEELEYFEIPVLKPRKPVLPNEYLGVPFPEKDQAKKLGAKWDNTIRKWYIPEDFKGDDKCFDRWRVKDPIYYTKATKSYKDGFLK